jgi:hypothetical protein
MQLNREILKWNTIKKLPIIIFSSQISKRYREWEMRDRDEAQKETETEEKSGGNEVWG